jgi:hypothetical protein
MATGSENENENETASASVRLDYETESREMEMTILCCRSLQLMIYIRNALSAFACAWSVWLLSSPMMDARDRCFHARLGVLGFTFTFTASASPSVSVTQGA